MNVKALRVQKGWSQDQLAQFSGLSVRTIQRIERGHKPGLESLKSLAAVFDIDITDLQKETDMQADTSMSPEEKAITNRVRALGGFYSHLTRYVVVMAILFIINWQVSPGYYWAWWAAMGWGIAVVSHGVNALGIVDLFGDKWEKRQIEKRMNARSKR
ncbi:XRE family transcriptional regulator [Salinivibrio sp. MA351]|uniref:2TM domain-containing protein n=1 Tax=unclassified Salinivibrio TaxID=2636825 RepID=UPI00098553A7|nr:MULTISPECIES: 2TM domain-containing protein [unclassified Salinivibrio]OOE95576.1 XRE family transcriptional regulator [Salinivibrio sp. AR640]OOE98368.1 XRE family transcriptional regulator [Salinivibrio sp. MA351]